MHDAQVLRLNGLDYLLLCGRWLGAKRYRYEENEQGRQAQWRPRRLRAGPLKDIADWVDQYRRHWEESFERLDTYFRELQDKQEQAKGDDDERDPNRPR